MDQLTTTLTTSPAGAFADSAGFLLSKIGADASRRYRQRLAALDLEPHHAALLRYVASARGLSQQALADTLQVARSRMVVLVDDLEQRNLIERHRSLTDRRAYALQLTDDGRQLLERAMAIAREFEDELCQPLQADERHQLVAFLRRLAAQQGIPLGVHPGLTERADPGGGC